MALVSKNAHLIENKLGFKKSFLLTQFLLLISVLLMSFIAAYIGALYYLIIPLVAGFFRVIINHYMNKNVESTHRATMLSIRTMFSNLGIFIVFPIVGYLSKNVSLKGSFILITIIMAGNLVLYIVSKK